MNLQQSAPSFRLKMSRWSQVTVMLVLGVMLSAVGISDLHTRYVKSSFGWALVASSLVLFVLTALTIKTALSEDADDEPDRAEPSTGEHGHDHRVVPGVGWAMLLPVVVLSLVTPQALGADAAQRQVVDASSLNPPTSSADGMTYDIAPLPDGDPAEIDLAVFTEHARFGDPAELAGRTVSMVGFVTPTEDGNGWYLTRMTIACCAADALAYKVRVVNQAAPPTDEWVTVVGSHRPPQDGVSLGEGEYPVLVADDVATTEQPVPPYL